MNTNDAIVKFSNIEFVLCISNGEYEAYNSVAHGEFDENQNRYYYYTLHSYIEELVRDCYIGEGKGDRQSAAECLDGLAAILSETERAEALELFEQLCADKPATVARAAADRQRRELHQLYDVFTDDTEVGQFIFIERMELEHLLLAAMGVAMPEEREAHQALRADLAKVIDGAKLHKMNCNDGRAYVQRCDANTNLTIKLP